MASFGLISKSTNETINLKITQPFLFDSVSVKNPPGYMRDPPPYSLHPTAKVVDNIEIYTRPR